MPVGLGEPAGHPVSLVAEPADLVVQFVDPLLRPCERSATQAETALQPLDLGGDRLESLHRGSDPRPHGLGGPCTTGKRLGARSYGDVGCHPEAALGALHVEVEGHPAGKGARSRALLPRLRQSRLGSGDSGGEPLDPELGVCEFAGHECVDRRLPRRQRLGEFVTGPLQFTVALDGIIEEGHRRAHRCADLLDGVRRGLVGRRFLPARHPGPLDSAVGEGAHDRAGHDDADPDDQRQHGEERQCAPSRGSHSPAL